MKYSTKRTIAQLVMVRLHALVAFSVLGLALLGRMPDSQNVCHLHRPQHYLAFGGGSRTCPQVVTLGNVTERNLDDLWYNPEHQTFRARVQRFDFAPCTFCGGCDLVEANEEDCFGNSFPTCGGCLWAQGVIQCP